MCKKNTYLVSMENDFNKFIFICILHNDKNKIETKSNAMWMEYHHNYTCPHNTCMKTFKMMNEESYACMPFVIETHTCYHKPYTE